MSSKPFPLHVGDYMGDTTHLSAEEHGAYLLLLMAMWQAGGSLPNDTDGLIRIARVAPRRWGHIRKVVLPFFEFAPGHITHGRLLAELRKALETDDNRELIQNTPPSAPAKVLKPNGNRELLHTSSEKPFENGLAAEPSLFPQESSPPNPPSKNTPISPSVSVARKRATKPKTSKKTFVVIRDVLETALSADMAQAVIQHRNITIKKPLTPLAAQQLVDEFRKAEDAGIAPDVSAQLMIRKGWRGFEADWAIPRNSTSPNARSPPAAHGSPASADDYDYSDENALKIAAKLEAKYGQRK